MSWFIDTSLTSNLLKHETSSGVRLGQQPIKGQINCKYSVNPFLEFEEILARKSGNLGCVGKCDTRRPVSRWVAWYPPQRRLKPRDSERKCSSATIDQIHLKLLTNTFGNWDKQIYLQFADGWLDTSPAGVHWTLWEWAAFEHSLFLFLVDSNFNFRFIRNFYRIS